MDLSKIAIKCKSKIEADELVIKLRGLGFNSYWTNELSLWSNEYDCININPEERYKSNHSLGYDEEKYYIDMGYTIVTPNVVLKYLGADIIKNKTMSNIKEKFSLIFKSEPQKSFRKAGITDGDDLLTEDGKTIFLSWLLTKHQDEFKKDVVDELLKEDK